MSVNIKNVTVTFKNQVRAVDHVNLEIPHGVYGLLGENGAGKTTLMRVLTTVLTPSDGEVYLDGIRYGTGKDEVIRQKIGYLPQELNLYPGLSVQDCLEYLGELSGIPKEECKKRIRYYLEKTGLTNHRKKKMRQLSGGMKRRVGLIQALLNEPEFLIVDEPTTGLDPEERVRIRNLLVDFSEGRTVLFSTHVVEDISATCSKLAVMRKGSFLYTGTVQALLSRAKGKIWTANVADDTEAKRLEKQYRTTSRQYTEEGMTVKIISDVKPDIDCTQPKITLEDAYLYLMMEKKKQ
ncbi:ABC transporter ATP-binding protein [Sellimonas sp.]|uniref:ABC transporter ATP-binding protein n=1 Tax=Sellimonas sp. TaxID=2021466 RepID=UPI00257A97E3|nr:ABC transporter ATP-binding protein [Sellimonas sp.]